MHAKDAIRNTLQTSAAVLGSYIGDLDDADLLVRPVAGMNHIAWQLGHLVLSERMMVESIRPGSSPALPEGFEEGHGREKSGDDDPAKYLPRAKYQELLKAQREATLVALEATPDEDLDRPAAERFQRIAPTVGAVFNLAGTHPLMHCGQFVAVRRTLKKPVTI